MSDDGRFLTVLTLLGLAGAAAARGSRGVVRAGRPPPEPSEIRIIRTRVSEARDYGRPLYVWTARRGERQIGSGWYDRETGYSRQGGSGKGAAVKAGLRELGFKNRISDQEMRHLLEAYPADAELLIDSSGGFHVLPSGSRGVVRAGRSSSHGSTRDQSEYNAYVLVSRSEEADPAVIDSGWERPEDAERRVEVLREIDPDLEIRVLPRRGLQNHGIDPLDDGRWR